MPNNIIMLEEELRRREQERQDEAKETFDDPELTQEEKDVLAEMSAQETHTVVTENSVSTPITEYAAPLDNSIKVMDEIKKPFKLVNTGDIVKTKDDLKREERERALKTFKDLAVSGDDLDDDAIVAINDHAIEVLKDYFQTGNLTADIVSKGLGKLSFAKIIEILPQDFVALYTTEAEVKANNLRARERLISSLVYLTTVGPEMDLLNEYIENGHRLTLVSQRILQCSVDLLGVLKSEEKMSEIADRAAEIDPPKNMPWEKFITGDPRRVHNAFAQNAAIFELYVKAYTELLDEYPVTEDVDALVKGMDPKEAGEAMELNDENMKARTLIEEQICESQTKADIYSSICRLDLFTQVVHQTEEWLKGNAKMNYQTLDKEGLAALERIRRSKQDVPFPTYDATLAKYPKELYRKYMKEFQAMLGNYNSALFKLQDVGKSNDVDTADMPEFIQIDGLMEESVHHYFALLLLIVYGRIMKRLTSNNATKYDAIVLDEYFVLYCSIGTDSYLMDDVWAVMKPFVQYAIEHWPRPQPKKHGK